MESLILFIMLAVLKESYPLNPEILEYDQYMKDFETTGRRIKQEAKEEKMDGLIMKRESSTKDSISGGRGFDKRNPFNKPKWEPKIPPFSELLNETYNAGLQTVVQVWWRQRHHISRVDYLRKKINLLLKVNITIQPFDDLLIGTQKFVDNEISIILDCIWGERKVKRNPLDTSVIDQQAKQLESLEVSFDESKFPRSLKENEKIVADDISFLRETLKRAKEELQSQFLDVEKAMIDATNPEATGTVIPFKWQPPTE